MIIILQEKLILKLFEKKKRVTNVNYTFISIWEKRKPTSSLLKL